MEECLCTKASTSILLSDIDHIHKTQAQDPFICSISIKTLYHPDRLAQNAVNKLYRSKITYRKSTSISYHNWLLLSAYVASQGKGWLEERFGYFIAGSAASSCLALLPQLSGWEEAPSYLVVNTPLACSRISSSHLLLLSFASPQIGQKSTVGHHCFRRLQIVCSDLFPQLLGWETWSLILDPDSFLWLVWCSWSLARLHSGASSPCAQLIGWETQQPEQPQRRCFLIGTTQAAAQAGDKKSSTVRAEQSFSAPLCLKLRFVQALMWM